MTTPVSDAVEAVATLVRRGPRGEADLEQLAAQARPLPARELSYLIRTTNAQHGAVLFRVLDKDTALAVFEVLPPGDQAALVGALRSSETAELIEQLDPDDRARLLDELPATVTDQLITGLSPAERRMTTTVLGYSRHAIGRYMSPEVLPLDQDLSAGDALERVRAHIDEPETVYLLPVIDHGRRLTGVIGLRSLLAADPAARVGDLAKPAQFARAIDDREEAARRFRSEKLLAMPIVDLEDRLLGILTVDDANDIIDAEDTENAARTGGAEPLRSSYLSASIAQIVRSRALWLLVLAVSAVLTVQVLDIFEDRLDQVVVLALFIPLLTGTGGNTGNQAATTVTRALATGEVRIRDLPRVIWRELRVGFLLGALLGSLGWVIASLVFSAQIGVVIGLTLLAVCTMAAVVGGIMPLLATKLRADPAVFSNPFISTFCDATGLVIYFSIATVVLGL
ncbi:magnesium transporter [Flexivirga sp. B27]